LFIGDFLAPRRHAVRPAVDQRLVDLLEAAPVDPDIVHQIRAHSAAAARMAAGTVVLGEQSLAGIHRLGVVQVSGNPRISAG
jgi:hypothetical protein